MLQADLIYGDLLRQGASTQLAHPSLLAITMLSGNSSRRPSSSDRPPTPPIPPHPLVVQRRMELLTSDMLTRALLLVTHGNHERALHLLRETRSILNGLGKGSIPPIPGGKALSTATSTATLRRTSLTTENTSPVQSASISGGAPTTSSVEGEPTVASQSSSPAAPINAGAPNTVGIPSPLSPGPGTLDPATVNALDDALGASLEWIAHPAVFARDSRKAVLQAIGVISSQRSYTFRTGLESLWAGRVKGVVEGVEAAKEWRVGVGGELAEEA